MSTVDEKGLAHEASAHDDPSMRIWSPYISEVDKHNRSLARSWKGDMDAILIFAGLFSASLTAFIVDSYKMLSPSQLDTTNTLLAQISLQLAAIQTNNASVSFNVVPGGLAPDTFMPPTSALICNILWFLSLGFSLACALSATLVEQWVRNYLQATESHPTPHERARICAYLYTGLEKFKMATLVETIPMLLHVSLLLFFAGLVEFLRPINAAISVLTLCMLAICVTLYGLATVMPIFSRDCPYKTPLSVLWWKIAHVLHKLRSFDSEGTTVFASGTMAQAREAEAMRISPERDQRDFAAMSWTLQNLRHESEFEAFLEVIPRAVAGFDYSAKLLLRRLLYHDSLSVRLGHRIPRLLISCTGGVLDPQVSQKRGATCLAAIWSLSMMAVHTDSSDPSSSSPILSRETLRFDEFTLRDIQTVKLDIPAIEDYTVSAAAVVARGLLDMYIDQAVNQENFLTIFIETQGTREFVLPWRKSTPARFGGLEQILERLDRTMEALEKQIRCEAIASSTTFILLSSVYTEITKLITLVAHPPEDTDTLFLASHALFCLQHFLAQVNQAGFSLTVAYAASFLSSRCTLPYEAFNTFRRLFLKNNFSLPVSAESQTRFVALLDDILDSDSPTHASNTRSNIPQSIINLVLGLTRAVHDPTCALKAKTIITRCMRLFLSEDEGQKALSVLEAALPRLRGPTLDLFTGHMYSNVKIEKQTVQPDERGAVTEITPHMMRRYD